jgi:HSP20 family protein
VRCEIDLPGVARDRISVSVVGDYLIVRGERANAETQASMLRYQERNVGPFAKTIALPPRARRDAIEAILRDGVLEITIPTDGSGADRAERPVTVR